MMPAQGQKEDDVSQGFMHPASPIIILQCQQQDGLDQLSTIMHVVEPGVECTVLSCSIIPALLQTRGERARRRHQLTAGGAQCPGTPAAVQSWAPHQRRPHTASTDAVLSATTLYC